ncbi:CAMP-dependent protein kinase regulatory subunit [Plakobranchus ocellatus]|uniref:cAMP-dependent protein kinase regulatory subunit n=1 Tax=Plakobranchus ocellatus TaxID=259542 RepID=A0AAV4AG20_9GAST|nr:CAMP-dependent protein kinase regulatory subunit [Plakobranchus ocellatus]
MAQITDQIIDTITQPPAKRQGAEMDVVISWLRRRVQILQNVDKETLTEIVRFCYYDSASRDDVIIQQGDHGDRMFILLRGSALVYIDTSLSGEEDVFIASPAPSPTRDPSHAPVANSQGSPDGKKRSRALDRSKYGRYIMKYGRDDQESYVA